MGRRPVLSLFPLVLLALVGCGSAGGAPAVATVGETVSASTAPARLVLRLRDDGHAFAVTRSTNITVVLGGPYRWTRPVSIGVPVNAQQTISDAPTNVTTWELRPARKGIAKVRSRGSPACRSTTPVCPQEGRVYTVTLIVR